MRTFLRVLTLAVVIGIDHTQFGQSLAKTTIAAPHSATKHGRLAHDIQPSDLPEILNIYDRDSIRALATQPGLAEAYLACASEDIAHGAYESAIRKVVNARVLDPEIANASTILASALNGLQRYDDAYLVLREIHGSEEESWKAMYERARAEVGIGNARGADLWSLRALSSSPPSFAQAHLIRGEALILTKRWQEARIELDTYMKLDADPSRHREALHALNVLSQFEPSTSEPVSH
jgi:tetratricopeptide (TPR) repeat protein